MLFADVRGSSKLARATSTLAFTQLMDRFYRVSMDVLVEHDAIVEKFVGDEVVGLFLPFLAGPDHAERAVERARAHLIAAVGYGSAEGPWLPLGAARPYRDPAFVGIVGNQDARDFTALGDPMNIAAHLASQGRGRRDPGHAVGSSITCRPRRRDLEHRQVSLKGYPLDAFVLPTAGRRRADRVGARASGSRAAPRHPPERARTVALVATLMFVSLAGAAIGESAVNALFFDRIGTQALPLMYLAQAGVTLVAMFALTAVLSASPHRTVYIWSPLLLAAVVVVAERGVLLTDARWIYPVLWVTVAFATLAQAIGLVGDRRDGGRHPSGEAAVPDLRRGRDPRSGGGRAAHPSARRRARRGEPAARLGRRLSSSRPSLCRLSLGPARPSIRSRGTSAGVDCSHGIKSGFAYVRRSRLLAAMAVGRRAVLRPLLLAVPAVRDGRHRSVHRHGRARRVLRARRRGDHGRRLPDLDPADEPAVRSVRRDRDDARAAAAVPRVVRHPARRRPASSRSSCSG